MIEFCSSCMEKFPNDICKLPSQKCSFLLVVPFFANVLCLEFVSLDVSFSVHRNVLIFGEYYRRSRETSLYLISLPSRRQELTEIATWTSDKLVVWIAPSLV